jgi:hypothetical protein
VRSVAHADFLRERRVSPRITATELTDAGCEREMQKARLLQERARMLNSVISILRDANALNVENVHCSYVRGFVHSCRRQFGERASVGDWCKPIELRSCACQ